MKKLACTTILALILSVTTTASRGAELLLAANNWPPYVDSGLPGNGLAIQIVTEALKRAGYTNRLTIQDWSRSLEGGLIGVYDALAAAWYTEARAEVFGFSEPYLFNEIRFIKKRGLPLTFSNMSDLDGLRIGVVLNYAYGSDFDDARNFMRVPQQHIIQNLLLLGKGDIALTLGDTRAIEFQLQEFMDSNVSRFEFLPKPVSTRGLRFAVSKDRPDHEEVIAAFNKAIAAMQADGSYDKILAGYDSPPVGKK